VRRAAVVPAGRDAPTGAALPHHRTAAGNGSAAALPAAAARPVAARTAAAAHPAVARPAGPARVPEAPRGRAGTRPVAAARGRPAGGRWAAASRPRTPEPTGPGTPRGRVAARVERAPRVGPGWAATATATVRRLHPPPGPARAPRHARPAGRIEVVRVGAEEARRRSRAAVVRREVRSAAPAPPDRHPPGCRPTRDRSPRIPRPQVTSRRAGYQRRPVAANSVHLCFVRVRGGPG
jgi:hypothetical protein